MMIKEFEQFKNEMINGDFKPFGRHTYKKDEIDIEQYLNKNRLNDIIEKYGDLTRARVSEEKNQNRFIYHHGRGYYEGKITGMSFGVDDYFIYKEISDDTIISSGRYWYPPNSYCGWHTNSDTLGERIYVVWCEEDNKSFFRYKDVETGKIITKWEKKGWQVNRFETPMWHCVGSYTNRVSFGFKKKTI